MFPKGQYNEEERQAMSQLFASKNPQQMADFMAKNESDKIQESKNLLEAYRKTRDF
jgi:hypothetical protein